MEIHALTANHDSSNCRKPRLDDIAGPRRATHHLGDQTGHGGHGVLGEVPKFGVKAQGVFRDKYPGD